MVSRHLLFMLMSLALSLPGWARAETPHWVHHRLLDGSAVPPKKVVIVRASVRVFEVTAGEVEEEVPEWSTEAGSNVVKAVSEAIGQRNDLQEVPMPRLSGTEAALVDEHMALYKLVVNTASSIDLPHKIKRFDYGIGPGLSALQARTGADAAVLIYGRDEASTAGRKTKAVLGKIPFVNAFTGDASLGHSHLHVGLVDLRTGDLMWMNSERRGSTSNLRVANDARSVVGAVFNWYPGIEQYRKAYLK